MVDCVVGAPHPPDPGRDDNGQEAGSVVVDVVHRPVEDHGIAFRFVEVLADGAKGCRVPALDAPVAEEVAVVGGVAVGLHEDRAGPVG